MDHTLVGTVNSTPMPLFQPRTYADVMPAVRTAVYAIWAVFWLYWLISAFSAKEGTGARRPRPAGLAVVLLAFVLLRVFNRDQQATPGPALKAAGLILLLLGLGLAVWARVYLGRNWGMPMTERAEPELVTSGPYRYVRHPIYSGILLGTIGTALALNLFWLIVLAVLGVYFIYSAQVEERNLAKSFPDTYPAYRSHTRMLIPFVF
jgi:protein-S-isoprenylcysteine O-methyltransferase Ste14